MCSLKNQIFVSVDKQTCQLITINLCNILQKTFNKRISLCVKF